MSKESRSVVFCCLSCFLPEAVCRCPEHIKLPVQKITVFDNAFPISCQMYRFCHSCVDYSIPLLSGECYHTTHRGDDYLSSEDEAIINSTPNFTSQRSAITESVLDQSPISSPMRSISHTYSPSFDVASVVSRLPLSDFTDEDFGYDTEECENLYTNKRLRV